MKRIIFCSLLVIAFATLLNAQNNNLIVYSQDGLKFTLILNGMRQNAEPQTNVKVTGLNAPTYQAKVIFANGLPDVNQNVYLMDGGNPVQNQELSAAIVQKKDKYKLQFRSFAPVDNGMAADPQQIVIVYNPNGYPPPAPGMTTQTIETTTMQNTNNAAQLNVAVPGMSIHMDVNDPLYGQSGTMTTTTTTTTISGSGNDYHYHEVHENPQQQHVSPYVLPGYNGVYGCPMPMAPQDFEQAKQSIASKSFDDSRLTIAKQIIGSNCMLCSQIRELMKLMSFEQTKLELAKFAWNHNLDKGNYYTLNDAFTFESSIDELNKYTQGH